VKILVCHNYYRFAGGESDVFDAECRILETRGHRVIKYIRQNSELDSLSGARKLAALFTMLYSRQTAREIETLCRKEKPDVAIVQNVYPLISPSLYLALKKAQVPVVQLVHNHRFVCVNAQLYINHHICELCVHGNFWHSIFRRCYRNSFIQNLGLATTIWLYHRTGSFKKCIDAFITPDEFVRQTLIRIGFSARKIHTNTNPYELPPSSPFNVDSDYFFYVGRFVPQKGVLTLVRAMAHCRSDARLLMVGDGESRVEIVNEIKKLNLQDRITVHPPMWGAEVDEAIAKARFVAIPSEWYDNGVNVVYKAFGLGKAIVASRIHGLLEAIADGVDGMLFEVGNPAALAEAIDCMWESRDKLSAMSLAAREKAELLFSQQVHYERLLEVLNSVRK
jgi:glycosyltransferase involved in cell wall biosynthesis